MKRGITLLSIALASIVALVFFMPQTMLSPGITIAAHAEINNDCFACHTPLLGSTPAKCIACHKVEEIGLKSTKGLSIEDETKSVTFHQTLIEDNCIACHSDHKGVQPFRPIGQFAHESLETGLAAECESCHQSPGDALHLKIEGSCSSCHVPEHWIPATFEHAEYFRFDRDHTTECTTCHVDQDYSSFTCYGCHEHSRSKIREEHVEEGIRDYERCEECHRSGDEDEAKYLWRSRRFNQEDTGALRNYRHKSEHDDDDDDD